MSAGTRHVFVSLAPLTDHAHVRTQLSSFPDIDGADDPLQFSSSGSEDEIDLGINGKISGAGNPNRPKVQQLAARLSEVTDIPLHKCIETIARFPDEDLNAINPNAPIPAQFLPPGTTGAQPRASYRAPAPPMMPYAAPRPRPQAPPPQPPVFHQPVQPPLHQQHLLREQSVQAASPLESKLETGPESEVVKKATRSQRPHDPNRPNFSYSALIGQAILSTPEKRLRLAEIYDYVMKNCECQPTCSFAQTTARPKVDFGSWDGFRPLLSEERKRLAELDSTQSVTATGVQEDARQHISEQKRLFLDDRRIRRMAFCQWWMAKSRQER